MQTLDLYVNDEKIYSMQLNLPRLNFHSYSKNKLRPLELFIWQHLYYSGFKYLTSTDNMIEVYLTDHNEQRQQKIINAFKKSELYKSLI